jgi:hypothetical protein
MPKCKILNFKESWTSRDVLGHAADVRGSRGREFKSRQPDETKYLVKWQIHLVEYSNFMIVFAIDHHLTTFSRERVAKSGQCLTGDKVHRGSRELRRHSGRSIITEAESENHPRRFGWTAGMLVAALLAVGAAQVALVLIIGVGFAASLVPVGWST